MKPRNLFELLCRGWLFFVLCSSLVAQDGFRAVNPIDVSFTATYSANSDPVVDDLLQKGLGFENDQRWGEALSHYEDSARRFPSHAELQRSLVRARTHFDVTRRYVDRSYLQALTEMSEQQTLDLFSEVVLKIQSHHVKDPDWNRTLRNGTGCLQIALKDKTFAEVNRIDVSNEEVDQLTDYVLQILSQRDVRDRRQAQELVRWVGRLVSSRLRMAPAAIILEYVCGTTSHLDPYSTFLTADQLDEVYSQIEGNFVGLGIELKAEDEALLIANVIPHGPADQAGILAGERIIGVNGVLTKESSADRAADMLKGEQGTYVDVTLLSSQGAQRTIHVRRDRVEVPSVEDVRMIDRESGVAYFKISSFQKTTSRDVDAALWKLHAEGMRSLIVDVRGNPGGLLNESVEVADRFIEEGTIVETHGRSARENYDYKAHRVGTWQVPLVVLIDGDSASASEIFAGAIHDHKRGAVVGERSYGKGSVQGIFPLRVAKGGVRLTTAKFYSPSGKAISEGGVEPDIQVHTVARPTVDARGAPVVSLTQPNSKEDPVLRQGTIIAREKVAARIQRTQQRAAGRSVQADTRRGMQRQGVGF